MWRRTRRKGPYNRGPGSWFRDKAAWNRRPRGRKINDRKRLQEATEKLELHRNNSEKEQGLFNYEDQNTGN